MRSVEGSPSRSVLSQLAAMVAKVVVGVTIGAAVLTAGGLALAHFQGDQVLTVVSGSMTPYFRAGDAVVISPVGRKPLHVGQVVTFHGPGDSAVLTTHRITAIHQQDGTEYLQTKGDANASADPELTPVSYVVGIQTGRVRDAGFWLALYQSKQGRLIFVAIPLLLLGGAQLMSMRRRKPVLVPVAAASTATATSVAVLVVVALAAGATVRPSGAVYAATVPVAANQFTTGTFCQSPSQYGSVVAADSPSLWYRFDDVSGTSAKDSSVFAVDGNYLGTTDFGEPGAIRCDSSTAAGFDGATTYLSNPALSSAPNTFSTEIWFRTTTLSGGRLIGFGSSQTGSSPMSDRHLYLDDAGHVVFGVAPAAKVTITSPSTYNDGQWHLADASLGPDGMTLYVDGAAVASLSTTTTGESYSGYWRVGYDDLTGWGPTTPTHFHFQGTLDEAAVYDYELTAAQVAAHYAANHS